MRDLVHWLHTCGNGRWGSWAAGPAPSFVVQTLRSRVTQPQPGCLSDGANTRLVRLARGMVGDGGCGREEGEGDTATDRPPGRDSWGKVGDRLVRERATRGRFGAIADSIRSRFTLCFVVRGRGAASPVLAWPLKKTEIHFTSLETCVSAGGRGWPGM